MIDWLLIIKNIKGVASTTERRHYLSWLLKSKNHQKYNDSLESYLGHDGVFIPLSESQLRSSLAALTARVDRTRRIRVIRRIVAGAVSVASALVCISFLIKEPSTDVRVSPASTIAHQRVSVPTLIQDGGEDINLESAGHLEGAVKIDEKTISYVPAGKLSDSIRENRVIIPCKYSYTVVLSDGTKVYLNANSELRYPTVFYGDYREVRLKGEGYFDVVKGDKPFIVTTDDLSIRVYGTEFNVNTNKRGVVETLLLSGSLGVTDKNSASEVMIHPNELFTHNLSTGGNEVTSVDPTNRIAWLNNMFLCDATRFGVLLDEIALWYGVEFECSNEKISNVLVSIRLSRETKLDNVIRALQDATGVLIIKKNMTKYAIE